MDLSSIVQQVQSAGGIGALAEKLGLSHEDTQKVAAAAAEHVDGGTTDAGELASKIASSTGLDVSAIQNILPGLLGGLQSHAGNLGDAAQSAFSSLLGQNSMLQGLLSGLDKNKDGSIVDDALGMVKGMFGGNKS